MICSHMFQICSHEIPRDFPMDFRHSGWFLGHENVESSPFAGSVVDEKQDELIEAFNRFSDSTGGITRGHDGEIRHTYTLWLWLT